MTGYQTNKTTVLLLGNYRPALIIARKLAAAGYRIALGLAGEEHGCRYSRYVKEVWDHPLLDADGRFNSALHELLHQRPDIGFVFPVTEEFVNHFALTGVRLPDAVTLISPRNETVAIFADKITTLSLCAETGVETLPHAVVTSHAELLSQATAIGFPLTIRPIGTTARLGHKKALILDDVGELQQAVPVWPPGHQRLLLQRFATGSRRNVYFAARSGQVIAAVESIIHRTNHIDGTGLAVDGETVPLTEELLADTCKLTAATGYTGIGLAQFIVDEETGTRCFLELNPRVSGSHAVPEMAAVELSRLALELSADPNSPSAGFAKGRAGLRYVWTTGDLCGAKMAIVNREIGITGLCRWIACTLRSFAAADRHMIWAINDPVPAIAALLALIPQSLRPSFGVKGDSGTDVASNKRTYASNG